MNNMEEEQAKKKFLMKVIIIAIMVLIFVFWFMNIKNVFRSNIAADNGKSLEAFKKTTSDFNATIDKLGQNLDNLQTSKDQTASSSLVKDFINETNKFASSTSTSTSNMATSSPINSASASSSASTSPNKINSSCPAYIDCMPTIGVAKPCQIPVGCEGITQIAY